MKVALPVMGSAILLFACSQKDEQMTDAQKESIMTEYSENLSVIMSQNGRRSYFFKTPLLEGYSLAREPFREFPKGISITTYQNDSLSTVDAVLTANYAIYYEKRDLWEARGDVVVDKSDGKTLYTQQLFWNAKTKKIYSNVDSKIVQKDGKDVLIGEGFESDDEFRDWRFRRVKGRMEVDVKPNENPGSTEQSTANSASNSSTNNTATDSSDQRSRRPAPSLPLRPGNSTLPVSAGSAAANPAAEERTKAVEPLSLTPAQAETSQDAMPLDDEQPRKKADRTKN